MKRKQEERNEIVVNKQRTTGGAEGVLQLTNDRNDCYANSAVTLLLSISQAVEFLEEVKSLDLQPEPQLCTELLRLNDQRIKGEQSDLRKLKKLVYNTNNIEWGATRNQQDTAEFMGKLVETIEDEIKSSEFLYTLFKTTFNVVTKPVFQCCRNPNHMEHGNEDILRPISLPLNKSQTLSQAWNEDRNRIVPLPQRRCTKCYSKGSQMRNEIPELPGIVMVQLKRFDVNGRKDTRNITIEKKIKFTEDTPEYELVGASFHNGDTMKNGHYVTVIRSEGEEYLLVNDTDVEALTSESADKMLQKSYLFVYALHLNESPLKKKLKVDSATNGDFQLSPPIIELLTLKKQPFLTRTDREQALFYYKHLRRVGLGHVEDKLANREIEEIEADTNVTKKELQDVVIRKMQYLLLKYYEGEEDHMKEVAKMLDIKLPKQKKTGGDRGIFKRGDQSKVSNT